MASNGEEEYAMKFGNNAGAHVDAYLEYKRFVGICTIKSFKSNKIMLAKINKYFPFFLRLHITRRQITIVTKTISGNFIE